MNSLCLVRKHYSTHPTADQSTFVVEDQPELVTKAPRRLVMSLVVAFFFVSLYLLLPFFFRGGSAFGGSCLDTAT